MLKYILKRILLMIPTLLGITILSFAIIQLAPGNPADLLEQQGGEVAQKKEQVSFESVDEFRRKYNLDKPLHIQYWTWLKKTLTFDFGKSLVYPDRTVNDLLLEHMPRTLLLSIISIILTYIIAIPIGVLSSVSENTWYDKSITVILFMLYSLPSFFVAIWLINLFPKGNLIWFPAQGLYDPNLAKDASTWTWLLDRVHHLVLPIFCLTYASYAYLSRQMRGGMLEVLRQDYIRTARSKGLSEKTVVLKHALKNSLIPIITIAAVILPALIGGGVILERIFNIPGMGWLSFEAIIKRDYNVIMAVFYLSSVLTLIGILISDILYVVINPRITFD